MENAFFYKKPAQCNIKEFLKLKILNTDKKRKKYVMPHTCLYMLLYVYIA